MRILLTGSSGRIGRALYCRLSPLYSVIGLDRTPASTTHIVGDINNKGLVQELCRSVDAIIHTAALHAPHVGIVPNNEFERINVVATGILLDAAAMAGIERIVFTSTTALYGISHQTSNRAVWVTEYTPPQPTTIYHRTKTAAEQLLHRAAERDGLRVRILRVSRCFPEPADVMAAYRIHRGIDARDVAEAHRLALHNVGETIETYIISGVTPFQPEDIEGLWKNAPRVLACRAPDLVEEFHRRGWSLPHSIDRVYDSSLAQKRLEWRPQFGYQNVCSLLDQGLSEVLPARRLQ
jgi:nucleoside-diphosphate-sugar epimerase